MDNVSERSRVLRAKTDWHDSDAVIVVVEHSGPAIGATQLDGIFEAFVTTEKKGMGLGLAICRRIIENLGANYLPFQTVAAAHDFKSFCQWVPKIPSPRNDFRRAQRGNARGPKTLNSNDLRFAC